MLLLAVIPQPEVLRFTDCTHFSCVCVHQATIYVILLAFAVILLALAGGSLQLAGDFHLHLHCPPAFTSARLEFSRVWTHAILFSLRGQACICALR